MNRIVYPSWECRIPRQRFDPLAAIVWLVLVPVSGALGWYGLWRLVCLIARFL